VIDSSVKAVHAVVRGRVQGIGFRQSAKSLARSLGLYGWVRNTAQGTVEVWAQGAEDSVNRMIDWLWLGPPGAAVLGVESDVVAADALLQDFLIRQ
jgi:acylphosphatase